MLSGIIKKFPVDVLQTHSEFIFLALATCLVNDEDSECRRMVAETIEQLLGRLEKPNRDQLFDFVILFLDGKKMIERQMAAQLCTRFVNVEKEEFEKRLSKIFPRLVQKLISGESSSNGGKFVKIQNHDDDDDDNDDEEDESKDEEEDFEVHEINQQLKDHLLIQIQNAVVKIKEKCPDVLTSSNFCEYVDELAYQSQTLLGYDHSWVRLNSAKILDSILASTDFDRVETRLFDTNSGAEYLEDERNFIYGNPRADIKSLILDFCAQLYPGAVSAELAEQVMKNLLYIANFLKNIPIKGIKTDADDEDPEEDDGIEEEPKKSKINLLWLIRRVRFTVNAEVAKTPLETTIRTAVFNWIDGIVVLLSIEKVKLFAPSLVAPLVREMNEDDVNVDDKLRQLAIRVGNQIKKRIGEDEYNQLRMKIQSKLMVKRAERKRVLAQEKVRNPEKAANRKIGIQNRKKVAKKRRMDVVKGRAAPKRKRVKNDW